MNPIIRLIKFILGVVWYITIISLFFLALVLAVTGTGQRARFPWYNTEVRLNSLGADQEIRLARTGELLHDSTFWGRHYGQPAHVITGKLAIHPPSRAWAFLYNVWMLLSLGGSLAITYLLRRLFRTVKVGTQFTRENVRWIRYIGVLIFGGTLLENLVDFALRIDLSHLVVTQGMTVRTSLDLDYSIIFLGLVVLVIAEFFRHGVELEEERSLTV